MSANELLERVKTLPPRERRIFFKRVHVLEKSICPPTATRHRRPIHWPDAAARRRKIFGDKTVPNLVLLSREQDRY